MNWLFKVANVMHLCALWCFVHFHPQRCLCLQNTIAEETRSSIVDTSVSNDDGAFPVTRQGEGPDSTILNSMVPAERFTWELETNASSWTSWTSPFPTRQSNDKVERRSFHSIVRLCYFSWDCRRFSLCISHLTVYKTPQSLLRRTESIVCQYQLQSFLNIVQ